MGEAGRARVAEKFSAERMVQEMVQVYGDVLGTNASLEPKT
jgi:hypothetical protein